MSINFTEMEKTIEGLKKGFSFVNTFELVSLEDIKKLIELRNKYGMSYVRQCIEKNTEGRTFSVQQPCCDCNTVLHLSVSKTELDRIIQEEGKLYRCEQCEKELKKRIKAEAELSKQDEENTRIYNTKIFITNYLSPNCSWNIPPKDWYKTLYAEYRPWSMNVKEIADFIKNMQYKDFLQTPYWKAISMKAKYKSGFKCQLCNSKDFLNVHHRSYEHHGEEITHLEDLIVLCNKCHSTFHNMKEE